MRRTTQRIAHETRKSSQGAFRETRLQAYTIVSLHSHTAAAEGRQETGRIARSAALTISASRLGLPYPAPVHACARASACARVRAFVFLPGEAASAEAWPSAEYNNTLALESAYASALALLHSYLAKDSSGAIFDAELSKRVTPISHDESREGRHVTFALAAPLSTVHLSVLACVSKLSKSVHTIASVKLSALVCRCPGHVPRSLHFTSYACSSVSRRGGVVRRQPQRNRCRTFGDSGAFREAIMLFKVWLRKRFGEQAVLNTRRVRTRILSLLSNAASHCRFFTIAGHGVER
eukprot:615112-Pleurochrysis_carterae.AAC.1